MNLRSVDLNLLTVFDAVMAEGNLTRAADKIGMSQPAISLALSRLRLIVGDELFVRSGRGVRPTRRARELMGPVRQALTLISTSLDANQVFNLASSSRVFNLVLGEYGDCLLLPVLLRSLQEAGSNVKINLPSQAGMDLPGELRTGSLDLILWIEPLQADEIQSELIGMDGHACLVRQGHPATQQRLTMKRFSRLQHMTLEMPPGYGQTTIDRIIHAQGYERQVACRFHSYYQVPSVLAASDYAVTLPTRLADHLASRYPLAKIDTPFRIDTPLYLNWSSAWDNDPGHQWLRQQITAASRAA